MNKYPHCITVETCVWKEEVCLISTIKYNDTLSTSGLTDILANKYHRLILAIIIYLSEMYSTGLKILTTSNATPQPS